MRAVSLTYGVIDSFIRCIWLLPCRSLLAHTVTHIYIDDMHQLKWHNFSNHNKNKLNNRYDCVTLHKYVTVAKCEMPNRYAAYTHNVIADKIVY